MLPGMAMIESKRKYAQKDLEDWNQYWNAVNTQEYPPIESPDFKYCSEFPIRSVTALRVALLEPKTVACIYRACWSEDKRVSDPQVLAEVLTAAGFDGPKLVAAATTGPKAAGLKEALKNNTDEAVRLGICGVSPVVFFPFSFLFVLSARFLRFTFPKLYSSSLFRSG